MGRIAPRPNRRKLWEMFNPLVPWCPPPSAPQPRLRKCSANGYGPHQYLTLLYFLIFKSRFSFKLHVVHLRSFTKLPGSSSTSSDTLSHPHAPPDRPRPQLRHSQHAILKNSLDQAAPLPRPLPPTPACHIPLPYDYPRMPQDPASDEGRDEKVREGRI